MTNWLNWQQQQQQQQQHHKFYFQNRKTVNYKTDN